MNQPEPPEEFTDRIERLYRELELAVRFDRPAILLAIYKSEFVRADTEAILRDKLRNLEQTVVAVQVSEKNYDIPAHLAEEGERQAKVFFISGLRWGGGEDGRNAYRALNIRREYFVDYHLRTVFWLTESEAVNLPRYAPDFWAFRHRVVEFVEPPNKEGMPVRAEWLAWQSLEDRTLSENTEAKIALREALLADLPGGDESLNARSGLHFTLGALYSAKRDNTKAIELYQKALSMTQQLNNPGLLSQCHTGLGNVYSDQGRYEEAIQAYQQAIALDPKFAYPYNGLGNVYRDQGCYDDAISAYNQAIQLDPNLAAPHNNLGNVYSNQGCYEEAIQAYNQAIQLDPKLAYPHNGLGNVYSDQDRYAEAIQAYNQAIQLDPKYASPHYGLGNVYRSQGRYEEATQAYQQAIALDPKFAYPYNGLGNVYRSQGRYEEAIQAYQQAIALDPKDAYPHNGLGDIYMRLKEFDKSRYHFNKRIRLSPDTAFNALVSLGIIERYYDKYDESIGYLQNALDLWDRAWQVKLQTPAGLLENKALALLCLGEQEEALTTLRQALDQRCPGDVIEFSHYEILKSAPNKPHGIEEMMAILQKTKAS